MHLPGTLRISSVRSRTMQKTVHSLCLMAFIVIAGVVSAQEVAQAQQQSTTEAHIKSQAFNWSELNRVYQAAIAEYNKKRAGKNASSFDVTSRLEAAGLAQAIDAPVKDISPQQAAAILNDYGFLAESQPLAEPALRRAIELDPKRRAAYLNLANLLRGRLPGPVERNRGTDAQNCLTLSPLSGAGWKRNRAHPGFSTRRSGGK